MTRLAIMNRKVYYPIDKALGLPESPVRNIFEAETTGVV
jgi:hypothetical protein